MLDSFNNNRPSSR